MTYGSLFSGGGGMDLGLDRAGMTCKWQVEIADFQQTVLSRHWPSVPKHRDVTTVGAHNLEPVDVIAGGFPCVDISAAGKGEGIEAPRSGLFFQFMRIIRELRPRFVIVENVARLLSRGMGRVLEELAKCGYDAEWKVFSACAFGAPHTRKRVFIVAYPIGSRLEGIYDACRGIDLQSTTCDLRRHWETEPAMDRVAYGLSKGVAVKDSLITLGNAVVPQVAEWIGLRIMEAAR